MMPAYMYGEEENSFREFVAGYVQEKPQLVK